MNRRETSALEWNERLGTTNGNQIAQVLRHFHERPVLLTPPLDHLEATARPFLEALGVNCRDIAALTLADLKTNPDIVVKGPLADIVWKWGNLRERAEECDDSGVAALEVMNTAACMLDERLVRPIFWELSRGLPQGAVLPQNIQVATFEGLAITFLGLMSTTHFSSLHARRSAHEASDTIGGFFVICLFPPSSRHAGLRRAGARIRA